MTLQGIYNERQVVNGVHQSLFPKGGACVLSVIRFQDGNRDI
jgi:hypothetical protein